MGDFYAGILSCGEPRHIIPTAPRAPRADAKPMGSKKPLHPRARPAKMEIVSDVECTKSVRGKPLGPMGASRDLHKMQVGETHWSRTPGGKGKGRQWSPEEEDDGQHEEYYWNRNPARGVKKGGLPSIKNAPKEIEEIPYSQREPVLMRKPKMGTLSYTPIQKPMANPPGSRGR